MRITGPAKGIARGLLLIAVFIGAAVSLVYLRDRAATTMNVAWVQVPPDMGAELPGPTDPSGPR
jgi:hypothetical protein